MADLIDRAEEAEDHQRSDAITAIQQKQREQAQAGSLSHCMDCGNEIPEARRKAVKGVRRCIDCQLEAEFFNKRGV